MPIEASKRAVVSVPPGFAFDRAVRGHGWYDLPPFRCEPERGSVHRGIRLESGRPAALRIRERAYGSPALVVDLTAAKRPSGRDLRLAVAQTRRMLRLDEDLGEFYRLARGIGEPDLRWTEGAGAGRLLRSPTVFEDLVKLVCTTNCTWALTRAIVGQLVARLGDEAPGGLRTFPTPRAMAVEPERFYRSTVRAGYRGGPLRDLARRVASGALDPEAWLDPAMPEEQLRREILSVKGAGPYVADNLMKLVGRYSGLGIDSWCRRKFSRLHRGGKTVTDRQIGRYYAPFGPWQGLALWCDITRDWFEGDDPEAAASEKLKGLL